MSPQKYQCGEEREGAREGEREEERKEGKKGGGRKEGNLLIESLKF